MLRCFFSGYLLYCDCVDSVVLLLGYYIDFWTRGPAVNVSCSALPLSALLESGNVVLVPSAIDLKIKNTIRISIFCETELFFFLQTINCKVR